MADVRADPDRIVDLAVQVEGRAVDLADEVDRLDRARAALGAQWTGAAFEGFDSAQTRWIMTMSDHARALADAASAARAAADAYARADEAVARMWSL